VVDKLVELGADVNQPVDGNGASALHLCLAREIRFKQLLILGADVACVDNMGATPLHYACGCDEREAIRVLIQHGAYPYAKTSFGERPIAIAVRNGHSKAIRALAESDVDLAVACTRAGDTPLTLAVRANKTVVVETLHRLGVAMNASNVHGELPLILAARSGDAHMIKLLVELGANVNHPVPRGESPLVVAVRLAHSEATRTLLALGADVAEAARALNVSVDKLNIAFDRPFLYHRFLYSASCFREAPVLNCVVVAPSSGANEPLSTLLRTPYLCDWFLDWLILPDLYALALVNRTACHAVHLHWSERNRRRFLIAEATLRALCPTRVAERHLLCRAMILSRGQWLVVESGDLPCISGSLQKPLVDVLCAPNPLANCVADRDEDNGNCEANFCAKCGTDSPTYATPRWGVCGVCMQTRPLMWLRWCRIADYVCGGIVYDFLDVCGVVDDGIIADAVKDAGADEPTLLTARALLEHPPSSRVMIGLPYNKDNPLLRHTFVALLASTDADALRVDAAQIQLNRKRKRVSGNKDGEVDNADDNDNDDDADVVNADDDNDEVNDDADDDDDKDDDKDDKVDND
jgi:ankyrin repeat protein